MNETIPSLFARQAAALGETPLFLIKRENRYVPITWRQAADDVAALSAFLVDQQLSPGDRVVVLSENRPEWGLADLAIQSVGGWTVPIYPSLPAQDIRVICADCQPYLGIASTTDQLQKLLAVQADVPSLRTLVVIDAKQVHSPQSTVHSSNPQSAIRNPQCTVGWTDALAQGRARWPQLRERCQRLLSQIRPEDTATLIYTSGTTGNPKGVMLSHQNFLSNVQACLAVIPIKPTDLHLSFLPLSHVFERMAGWYLMLTVGARVAYAESMETIAQDMAAAHPTIMLGVPRFFEKLHARIQEAVGHAPWPRRRLAAWALRIADLTAKARIAGRPLAPRDAAAWWVADHLVLRKFRSRLGGRLRFFVSGSAPLSKEIGELFFSLGVTILEGYGLTETSPVITVNRLPIPRFGSVGQAIPGVEVRIAEDGEILTRGPHVMQGYYRQPEATAAMIVEGWCATGDIGHLDAQGFLFITDRKKDLIKTAGGKFIAPQKLEGLLLTDPYIAQAFVYGDRQPYCVALLVPNLPRLRGYAQEQGIEAPTVKALVNDQRVLGFYWSRVQAAQQALASFEQLKKIALLDEEFTQASGELTPTLKAKRNVIAQRHAAALRRLYEG